MSKEITILKVSEEPKRLQQCFSGLDMKADTEDLESINSFSSSLSGSISSLSSNILGSISGVLSSAMSNALILTAEAEISPKAVQMNGNGIDRMLSRPRHNYYDGKLSSGILEAVDFEWLRERCDGDNELVTEVLNSFCEQGQKHLGSMQRSLREIDIKGLQFHAVTKI